MRWMVLLLVTMSLSACLADEPPDEGPVAPDEPEPEPEPPVVVPSMLNQTPCLNVASGFHVDREQMREALPDVFELGALYTGLRAYVLASYFECEDVRFAMLSTLLDNGQPFGSYFSHYVFSIRTNSPAFLAEVTNMTTVDVSLAEMETDLPDVGPRFFVEDYLWANGAAGNGDEFYNPFSNGGEFWFPANETFRPLWWAGEEYREDGQPLPGIIELSDGVISEMTFTEPSNSNGVFISHFDEPIVEWREPMETVSR